MADYFEIDFLDVESSKSGDAIPLRYENGGVTRIHVVDGGFQDTGESLVKHINTFYGSPGTIDSVVVTHPDGDHAGGLRSVLEQFAINELWMLRPWVYADELLPRFARFKSADGLASRLKEIYPNITALEEIATEKRIPIREPFQGAKIGAFTVFAPTKARYLDLVVQSEKTPQSQESRTQGTALGLAQLLNKAAAGVAAFLKAAWGVENFSPEETAAENEMSVVQYAKLCNLSILLTGDAGRAALTEAADYAPCAGVSLPGIDRFQVPHHGSRRNVSTAILDRWLGARLARKPEPGKELFTAVISAAKKDEDHPRKAVVRAMIHRGAMCADTQGKTVCISSNAPARPGWTAVDPMPYPDEEEKD